MDLIFQERKKLTSHIWLYTFNKPDHFHFKAGQYADFTLNVDVEQIKKTITRSFSLLSTPEENYIQIAVREQNSDYSVALFALNPDDKIGFYGPFGTLFLDEEPASTSLVLIAGGIGVAPFYSIIKQITYRRNFKQPLYLFYGNQVRTDAALINELQYLENAIPSFKFIPTLTVADENWNGETGLITAEMIQIYVRDYLSSTYYICGPNAMLEYLYHEFTSLQIKHDQIKTDNVLLPLSA